MVAGRKACPLLLLVPTSAGGDSKPGEEEAACSTTGGEGRVGVSRVDAHSKSYLQSSNMVERRVEAYTRKGSKRR